VDRRAFLGALALLAAPLAAEAQQPGRVYRVGHLSLMTPEGMAPYVASLESALAELGYVKGRNLIMEDRSANGQLDLLPTVAAELVRLNVDVIVTGTNQGVVAVLQTATATPVVIVYGTDPVGAGLVRSLARPGGNVTGGTYDAAPEIYGKTVAFLKEAMPRLTRMACLWNPGHPGAATYMEATKHAARRLALGFQPVAVRVPSELDEAFAAMVREHAQGIIVVNDPVLFPLRAQIARTATRRGVPVVGSWKEFAAAGALLSYGPNAIDPWRRAAVYIDKILKGAKAGDLPMEQPTKFELVINLKTAKALGLTIPPSLLARADQVIE
jgi:ABC-type uncharacterized transport system substrate-binding protein